ncbi:MAG: hypothetical protein H6621_08615 [Halobacteriovoraceae bacterium]|nr:hypothetical protein [Halobacteriovoraceae bacterium]MCB9095115.1 hypothetical protein [Halobacteriovoraceae bacterium]
MIVRQESTRIDLLGGTLDIYPINHYFENVITLNLASHLLARVELEEISEKKIIIESLNYQSTHEYALEDFAKSQFFKENIFSNDKFQEMSFACLIISYFKPQKGLKIKLGSKAPHGSGLGGSSSLGITLFQALCDHFQIQKAKTEVLKIVQHYESMILGQGVPGYQDYYPALYGGILALKSSIENIEVEQLASADLVSFIEKNIFLIDSKSSRDSGINNWEVFKRFYDKDKKTIQALNNISQEAYRGYRAIKDKNYDEILDCMKEEGRYRVDLAPRFITREMLDFQKAIESVNSDAGIKVCGAGGGGCFLCFGVEESVVAEVVTRFKMEKLPLKVCPAKEL